MNELIDILRIILAPIPYTEEDGMRYTIYFLRAFLFAGLFSFVDFFLHLIKVII